jgi:hypothetical protein
MIDLHAFIWVVGSDEYPDIKRGRRAAAARGARPS